MSEEVFSPDLTNEAKPRQTAFFDYSPNTEISETPDITTVPKKKGLLERYQPTTPDEIKKRNKSLYVVTNIDREGEVAIASRSMATHKIRRSFSIARGGHQSGGIVPCRLLVVGPKKCLVECGGYDVSLSQRDLSYSAIADLRKEFHTGQELQAVIKEFSAKDNRIEISVKEVNPNPFEGAEHRHQIGSRRQAIISGKYKGGIFCTLSDKIVCLCLYSNSHFDTEFFTGDRVLIQITQYDYGRELIYGRIVTKL